MNMTVTMAVAMTVTMTFMPVTVAGECGRRNEQSGGNCRH
jgi:hypothetical protein